MKNSALYFPSLFAGLIFALAPCAAGQSFLSLGSLTGIEGDSTVASDSGQYADGLRALREARWNDAETYFEQVLKIQGRHAEGALYWKAYAAEKKGQPMVALDTCKELARIHPGSNWNEECGALEVQIRSKNNLGVDPIPAQSDEVKLLALNSLIDKNESRALAQIAEILNGDSSDRLKQGALYILGEHHDDVTYPQIVRLSYAEGDVRIARGAKSGLVGEGAWEKAVAGLPLETGFSLVTGKGKAEIEFENASTISLGENSVLTLNDLHTTVGVPYSEVALLTGTVSIDIQPFVANEAFVLKTPTDNLLLRYPSNARFRVDSYLDAMAITPLTNSILRTPDASQQPLVAGKTLYFQGGRRIDYAGARDSASLAAWDQWVATRSAARSRDLAEVMKAAGLTQPIPGLADMAHQGTFFDCPPYGACWEPTPVVAQQAATQPEETQPEPLLQRTSPAENPANQAGNSASSVAPLSQRDPYFPCTPEVRVTPTTRNLATGKMTVMPVYWQEQFPYAWAVCHAGGWIHHHSHYVWVAGQRRHHHPPYQWVKSGHTVAYVPLHPHDVKGQPPVNRKAEVFVLRDGIGVRFERAQLDPSRPIELMKTPPKEFRAAPVPQLAQSEDPHPIALQLRDALVGKNSLAKAGGVPISFDHRSQSFLMTRQVIEGHRSATVLVPLNNPGGNLQTHAANFGGGSHFGGGGGGGHVGMSVTSSTTSSRTTNTVATTPVAAPSSGTGVTSNGPSPASHH